MNKSRITNQHGLNYLTLTTTAAFDLVKGFRLFLHSQKCRLQTGRSGIVFNGNTQGQRGFLGD
ncbi:MAG: hypothetical protein R2830_12625 [Saprospiraceae bacterium]